MKRRAICSSHRMQHGMPRESKKIEKLFHALVGLPLQRFPLVGGRLQISSKHGVYIIYGPQNQVLHVGRTVRGRKGLAQRLRNHLHGASSFAIKYLGGKGSKLRGTHKFACIEVSDPRTRALLESYAVGHLCPKHLGMGEIAA